jgi:hypothetical protein
VHRVVLPYRAWELVGILGAEHAHTLLRQSVRYCVRAERGNPGTARALLSRLFDQHRLESRSLGTRAVDDAWIDRFAQELFQAPAEQAAEAVAAALVDGIAPDAVAEAISLAANQIVLRDQGRPARYANAVKPAGSVHGDSLGVHASDLVNAYRNMARVTHARNTLAGLILAAFDMASSRWSSGWGTDFATAAPHPLPDQLDQVRETSREQLLAAAEEAIRGQDQARAAAVVHRYGALGHDPQPAFNLLLRYAVSEDGALHAEKYFQTVSDEFAHTRPAFRWRQLVALARVTASEFGRPAPGYAEARSLLKV